MRFILIISILFNIIFASENLSSLITKFKTAPKSQKYIYMNRIKTILRNLNSKERLRVINSLKSAISSKNSIKVNNINIQNSKITNVIKDNCKVNNMQNVHNQMHNQIKHNFPMKMPKWK